MNIYDIHLGIQQGLQKNAVFAYQDLEIDEIDLHLNLEILDYIKDTIRAYEKPQDGYNKDSYNLASLKNLYVHRKEQAGFNDINSPAGSKKALIDNEMLLPIRVYADLERQCGNSIETKYTRTSIYDADMAYDLVDHAIHGSSWRKPISFIENNTVSVLTNGKFKVSKIFMDYVRKYDKPKLVLTETGEYDPVTSVQIPLYENAYNDIIERTIARIKNYSEGNPQVIQRIDQKQMLN
jgi:hypothetical protein